MGTGRLKLILSDFLTFATVVRCRSGRVRRPGGGRKKKSSLDQTLVADLKGLAEPTTRGARDPMGRAPASTIVWILGLNPPRARPIAWFGAGATLMGSAAEIR